MTSVAIRTRRVQPIPADSDGLLVPRLIPVAAYLCSEEYPDAARSRILERLADGVSPRVCCLQGALEWSDLAEVERLLAPRPAAAPAVPPRGDEWGSAPGSESMWMPLDDRWELGPGPGDPAAIAAAAPVDLDGREPWDSWPRTKTADDLRADMAAVREWYATHPGE